jgi:esterase, PHB depolymerase family
MFNGKSISEHNLSPKYFLVVILISITRFFIARKIYKGAIIMRNRPKNKSHRSAILTILLTFLTCIFLTRPSSAVTLQQITDFGTNPTNLQMYIYVPANVKTHPSILVVPHACHGTALSMANSDWSTQATQYGFIVIYPGNLSSKDSCWDVHSTASLTHNGSADPLGIVSMVKYVEQHYNGDSNRVYVAGHSSGGMMTNVLLGSYPDIFKAGAAFAGVAFGCFAAGPVDSYGWCSSCATGQITKTAAQWGDIVRAAYPGYTGPRPRIQLWHGTADNILNYTNFGEEIKEWTNVLGVSQTATTTETNTPQSTWTRTRYANSSGQVEVEAISEQGQPHNLVVRADLAIVFLGLDKATGIDDGKDASINFNRQNAEVKILRHEMSKSLSFEVSSFPGRVGLVLYDLNGQKIHTIAEQNAAKGTMQFSWDGRIHNRSLCPAGVYVLSVRVNGLVVGNYRFAFCAN